MCILCFGVVVDLGRTCVCVKLSPYVLGVMVDCVRLGSVPFLVGFVDSVSGCNFGVDSRCVEGI